MTFMKIKYATNDLWQRFVDIDTKATFFQTPLWHNLSANYQSTTTKAFLLNFSNGQEGIFPSTIRKKTKGLTNHYGGSPFGTYSGIISEQPLEDNAILEWIDYLRSLSSVHLRMSPFEVISDMKTLDKDLIKDYSQLINLEKGFDAIFKTWTKGHSSAAKKAFREGVQVSKTTNKEDWDSYYLAYEDSLKRWGNSASNSYSKKLFNLLQEMPSSKVTLWKATYENELIYGCLCFYHHKHIVYWHGAGFEDYFKLRAVHALQYTIIKDGCEKGYQWYDFNPSGGHEGVMKFKKGFGTEILQSPLLIKESFLESLAKSLRKN